MIPKEYVDLDIRVLFSMIAKRFWIVAVITALAGLISGIVSFYYMTPIYEASTQILVNNSAQERDGYRVSDIDRDLKLVETYSVIIKSPRIMEKVIEQTGLNISSNSLTEKVSVSRVKESQVISITVRDPDLHQAVLIANTIAKVFQREILSIMKVDNVQILAVAKEEWNPYPVKPKPFLNILTAMAVAFLAGIGVVFFFDYFDKYVHSELDVERILRLPVLGTIPIGLEHTLKFDKKLPDPSMQQANIEIAVSRSEMERLRRSSGHVLRKLVTVVDPQSVITEAYRTLRTNIQFMAKEKRVQSILVTNSGPGKGQPSTIANLAIVIAHTGRRVLLIDADMRNPNLHLFFRHPNQKGLSNILAMGEKVEDTVQQTFVDGLYMIPSGPTCQNPAELLSSERMGELMDECKRMFDYVIIDSPPVVPVTDAQVLSTQVDGVILVIHAGRTNKATAVKAKQLLEKVHARVLGVVLNDPKKGATRYHQS